MEEPTGQFGIIAVCLLVLLIAGAIVIKFILFYSDFKKLRIYLKTEIDRSVHRSEKRYWKRELRNLYLCWLPFININNIAKFTKSSHSFKRYSEHHHS